MCCIQYFGAGRRVAGVGDAGLGLSGGDRAGGCGLGRGCCSWCWRLPVVGIGAGDGAAMAGGPRRWHGRAGPGWAGRSGSELGRFGAGDGPRADGADGRSGVLGVEVVLALLLVVLALGLTAREWRGPGAGPWAGRSGLRGARSAAGGMRRGWWGGRRRVWPGPRGRSRSRCGASWSRRRAGARRRHGGAVAAAVRAQEARAWRRRRGGRPALRPPCQRARGRLRGRPGLAERVKARVAVAAKKAPAPAQQSLPLMENGWQFPPLEPAERGAEAGG